MISLKTITAICLGATLCTAQTINISGIVKDTAGNGISGAAVKLEAADISATTGADGSFTLDGSVQIQRHVNSRTIVASPIQFQNNKITIDISETTPIAISIYNVSGGQLYSNKRTYGTGKHTIAVPVQSTGIFIYQVNIVNESYTFKSSPFGTFSTERSAASGGTSALAKQAKVNAVIADVISVVKQGQLNYRDSIKTSDTSGIVIKMIPNAGNVTDADGNVYQTVQIGDQVWTVENLRTTKYNDGTDIPHVTNGTVWLNIITPAYCFFDNNTDATYQAKWGALYNWYAVNTGKLAPEGWRVPTDAEWTQLEKYLIANGYNWDGSTSGYKTGKSLAAKTDWAHSSEARCVGNDLSSNNGTNFSALPGGCRNIVGGFYDIGGYGYWWSATEDDASLAYGRYLYYGNERLSRYGYNKECGFSVRLLRDN